MIDKKLAQFSTANGPDLDSYKPIIYNPANKGDQKELERLLEEDPSITVHDTYEQQVKEFIRLQHPSEQLTEGQISEYYNDYLSGQPVQLHGNWVYYPWNATLVHLLREEDFIEVRTNRNKYKITNEERDKLAQKKVGIIGLSVGQSAAVTMAMERICGELRIADFDTLDLSNLNRIRSDVHSIGQSKAVMVAREIAELDPYLKVTCFFEGITHENLSDFLTEDGPVDLLADECDSMDIKFACRFAARKYKIPVVMDTSDRGLFDIERFDQEPDRKIFHGRIDEGNIKNLDRMMILDAILDLTKISERGKYSLGEMGKTITTWPQLATSVTLGGSLVATATRKILLGESVPSGRHYFDVESRLLDK